ncbi:hypothetical protein PAXRUDRAFT_177552 [Paxillus rubicundulus Ve08.2h10]|uniref:CxC2-like cysteine cluster KDZ transposase-associated domain-containing protein n=1 Tax=Paxillus rubicundulus Ve08.2h10 TaxID=930991 RepID=A0A0D0CDX3_9AGAM|nr:hypothetical protein PAXRUDRAFT_177552 [Paxillus rubicundulus Ve08.2h10]
MPLKFWLPERSSFVDEFVRLEGRGNSCQWTSCSCGYEEPEHCCDDCFSQHLSCKECTVQAHRNLPLHRIKHWLGGYFADFTLKSLGLHVQLGHKPGGVCPNQQAAFDNNFVVIDVHSIHAIGLDFCGCELTTTRCRQLLCACWFPVTVDHPHTAATFSVLQFFKPM